MTSVVDPKNEPEYLEFVCQWIELLSTNLSIVAVCPMELWNLNPYNSLTVPKTSIP
jgi:hypothetical protein